MRAHDEIPGRKIAPQPIMAIASPPIRRSAGHVRIKKITPEQRRYPLRFDEEPRWYRRVVWRLSEDSQYQRSVVQVAFVLLCTWIGVEFHSFVAWGQSVDGSGFASRPPGVEGFLPIGALISLFYWAHTGIVNSIHPSGLFILLAVLAVSIALKKAFCSWLCPIGTLSEGLWMLGKKLFRRNIVVPRWMDYPLRSLKYVLMAFFVWSILNMDEETLRGFIYSPYNKMADVKMYLFFAEISGTAIIAILLLMLLSVMIKNFWCRYLCPYGALLGIVSLLSPLKITRTTSTCVDCELCTKACPSGIKVHKATRVNSDECMSCMACVEICPVKDTLTVRMSAHSRAIPSKVYGVLVVGVFVAITGAAMLAGFWQNSITSQEYQRRIQHVNAPIYQHFRGQVPQYGPND
jgi:ferredoxin